MARPSNPDSHYARQKRMKPYLSTIVMAERAFEVYYADGPGRSLEKLYEKLKAYGLKPRTRSTLAQWSSRFEWQRKLAEREDLDRQAREDARTVQLQRMNERQAFLGATMQTIAADAMQALRKKASELGASEVATLVREGTKVERLARGAATERAEIAVSIWTTVIHEIVGAFARVNELPDPEVRKAEFADLCDGIIEKNVAVLAAGGAVA